MTESKPFTTSYKIPDNKLSEIRENVEKDYEEQSRRLESLITRSSIDGIPIIAKILDVTHDSSDLLMLSRVLERVSEILPGMEELYKRKVLLETISDQKNWLQLQFGDFDATLNSLVNEINSKGDI